MKRLSKSDVEEWTDAHGASSQLCQMDGDGVDSTIITPEQDRRLIDGEEYRLTDETFIGAITRFTDDGGLGFDTLFRDGDTIITYSGNRRIERADDESPSPLLLVGAGLFMAPVIGASLLLNPVAWPAFFVMLIMGVVWGLSVYRRQSGRLFASSDESVATALTDEQYRAFPLGADPSTIRDGKDQLAYFGLVMDNYEEAYNGEKEFVIQGTNRDGETVVQAHDAGFHETYDDLHDQYDQAMRAIKSQID